MGPKTNSENGRGRNPGWEFILAILRNLGVAGAFFFFVLVFFQLRSSRCNVQSPQVAIVTTATVEKEFENSEEGGAQNGQITTTRAPFLSLSSYIIPIFLPVPNGYWVINIALNDIILFVLARMSNDLVTSPILNYLVEDWNENYRKDELIGFFQNIRDRTLLLQINFVRILSFYVKLFQGPEKSSDSDWFKKENLLNQKEANLNFLLGVRSIGPARSIFTRHGTIVVWPRRNDNSIKREIKERSKFQTKELKHFFYMLYQELLDRKMPWNATYELGPGFMKQLEQSRDHSQLVYPPILGSKDYLTVDKEYFHVNIFFNADKKEIKIESFERKTQNWLLDCFVAVVRIKLVDSQPNNLGFTILLEFEQRSYLTLRRKLAAVFIAWYYYRNRRYLL